LLLFEASRAQLVRHVIQPALEKGVWVLCDRFMDSTTAYQGYGRGFDVEAVLGINRFAVAGYEPDLTLLLDIETQKGLVRLEGRNHRDKTGHDRIEREERAFHERVRAGFLQLARKWPERIRLVDAMRAEDDVESAVWEAVQGMLKP
jgi:dTMP kinase